MASPGTKYTTVSGLILLLIAIMIWWDSKGTAPPNEQNPECPHTQHELTLPENTTSVPEFHDCQRLVGRDGKTYGTLAGVFARKGLGDLTINTVDQNVPVVDTSGAFTGILGPTGDTALIDGPSLVTLETRLRHAAVSVAQIESYDSAYRPLGIVKGHNCLYLVRLQPPNGAPYSYRGLMIAEVADPQTCFGEPPATGGKWLTVYHTLGPAAGPGFPAVSRWDWDAHVNPDGNGPPHNKQYVSMFCGRDWCDVGDADLVPVPQHEVTLASAVEEVPWEQKGRYDEQRLAIDVSGTLRPSAIVASAFPTAELDSYTDASFGSVWKHVANTVLPAEIDVYRKKFNYGAGSIPGITNQVFVCSGWRFHCMPFFTALQTLLTVHCWKSAGNSADPSDRQIWWAKMVGSDGSIQYRCVTKRIHPGVTPPTAARWRWKMRDEGLWTRCGEGCCEVEEK
jgi:hypothetical protein